MEDKKVETVETQNTQDPEATEGVTETPEKTTEPEAKKPTSTEIVRELSKQFSVNLFDEGGVQAFLEKINTSQSDHETLKQDFLAVKKDKDMLASKEQEYQTKIEALSLGFAPDTLDEVLALARVNMKEGQAISDGLKAVKEKYASVFVQGDIGTLHNDRRGDKPDAAKNERDRYLAESKAVQTWKKTQGKN